VFLLIDLTMIMENLNWVEISADSLSKNLSLLRDINAKALVAACVKGNAYGHGLDLIVRQLNENVDWWAVNAVYEADVIRKSGFDKPILILGYVSVENLEKVVELGCRLVIYSKETVEALGRIGRPVKVHLKVESGLNRQGLRLAGLERLIDQISKFENIEIEGAYSHFANIEDTTDHSYAYKQMASFREIAGKLERVLNKELFLHMANSAASLIFPQNDFSMIRPGLALYGLWPSQETKLSFRKVGSDADLLPVLSWKTRVVQIKAVSAGEYVGYGCTYRTTSERRLAVLPIGYYDGYSRSLGAAYVLIRGKRASICGRICMNIMVVDVSDVDGVCVGDEVVLIGKSGDEKLTAEDLAAWAGTINYEIVTRINENMPRVLVN